MALPVAAYSSQPGILSVASLMARIRCRACTVGQPARSLWGGAQRRAEPCQAEPTLSQHLCSRGSGHPQLCSAAQQLPPASHARPKSVKLQEPGPFGWPFPPPASSALPAQAQYPSHLLYLHPSHPPPLLNKIPMRHQTRKEYPTHPPTHPHTLARS